MCERCGKPGDTFRITEGKVTRRVCEPCARSAGWRTAPAHEPCVQTQDEAKAVARALRKWLKESP